MKLYGPYISAGARLSTRNVAMPLMPRWFAGSKYSDIMHRTCTATTLMFLQIQRKQPFACRKEGRPNYFFQKAKMSHTSMSAICQRY
jgi:hypothetical protein